MSEAMEDLELSVVMFSATRIPIIVETIVARTTQDRLVWSTRAREIFSKLQEELQEDREVLPPNFPERMVITWTDEGHIVLR